MSLKNKSNREVSEVIKKKSSNTENRINTEANKIIEIRELEIAFFDKKSKNSVVNKISFDVLEGEILGVVGESGSGKSMTALAIASLLPKEAVVLNGTIDFLGKDLLKLSSRELRKLKGNEIAMIFQEPMTSLNPLLKVGYQVEEMLQIHSTLTREERKEKTYQMLSEVGFEHVDAIYEKYPHQLSGGMRQRVMIAMAMICSPKLLIADEPTTALDVTIQAQILELIQKLSKEYGTSVIFISHDLGVIKDICTRTIVMSEGTIVEVGHIDEIFEYPKEEYTMKLLDAVPSIKKAMKRRQLNERKADNIVTESIQSSNETDILNKAVKDRGTKKNVLEVKKLNVYYEKQSKLLAKKERELIVKDVSFSVKEGEIVGIVGESGCGKSTLTKAIVGLNKQMDGEVISSERHPQMVFQDPYQSLNPLKKVGWILEEPLRIKGGYTKAERQKLVLEMLKDVGLKEELKNRYVRELSGGQRQRVSIAMAIITNTKLVILDEPVSALDVTVQAQIIELLLKLRKQYGLTYLFISHDLNVIYEICDKVLVMYQGQIVEEADIEELYQNPKHEYSKTLLKVIPQI